MQSKTKKIDSYFAGLEDCKQRKGYLGRVLRLKGGHLERVALVYGDTLKIMRKRKHAIVDMLNKLKRAQ